MKRACILLFTLAAGNVVKAQAPGVPVYVEGRDLVLPPADKQPLERWQWARA